MQLHASFRCGLILSEPDLSAQLQLAFPFTERSGPPVNQPSSADIDLSQLPSTAERAVNRDLSTPPTSSPSGRYAGAR